MRHLGRSAALAVLLAVALAVLGCRGEPVGEPGVAATVNGEPITVAALEARHDLSHLGAPVADNPTVDRLRTEYGAVLADLIVARLAGQELARQRLAVTEADLVAAEAAVRADYPGDAFERMLVEERIDLALWRETLRDHLTLDKFARDILRPNVRVGVTEAADYYKEHIDAFTQPARTRLLMVRAREAEVVKAALAAYRKAPSREALEAMAGLSLRELTISDRNLAKPWREALSGLKPGQAGPVQTDADGSAFLVLLERQPETVLEPAKAYAQVEAILTARKLERAMADWLVEAAGRARIAVNPQLVAAADREAGPERAAEPPADVTEPAGEPASRPADAGAPVAAVSPPQAEPPAEAEATPPVEAALPAPVAEPPAAPVAAVASPVTNGSAQTEGSPSPVDAPAAKAESVPEPRPETLPAPAPEAAAAGAVATEPPAPSEGVVEFTAIKASWILYSTDEGAEERTYLKPGKPLRLTFSRRLSVRLGSPSEVSYRYGTREETVAVGKKESRVLEFP